MRGTIHVRAGEYVPLLHPWILAGREHSYSRGSSEVRRFAIAAGQPPFCQQIAQAYAAARLASRDAEFVVLGERQQEKPSVLERNARGSVKFEVRLVGLTQQRPRFERADSIARFEFGIGTTEQTVHDE